MKPRFVDPPASPRRPPAGQSEQPTSHSVHAPGPDASSDTHAFTRIFGMTVGLFALIGATYVVSPLHALRPWVLGGDYVPFWNIVGREWLGEGESLEAEAAKVAKLERQTREPKPKLAALAPARVSPQPEQPPAARAVFPVYFPAEDLEPPEHGIEPPEALDPYYLKLTLADLAVDGAIARASHWGDSVLGVDGITSAIRRRMQRRFGDAGHGFHLIDRYHPSYKQQGIDFDPGPGWNRCLVVFDCRKKDRRYGYGGLVVDSNGGAAALWRTPKTDFGKTVSKFELWFARQETGGTLEITIDGNDKVSVDTRGPHLEDAFHEIRVAPGPHSFKVRAAGGGNVRAYGVVLENDGPGVVWDGIAHISGSTRWLRTQDPDHIESQVRQRDVDLVVFMFGGNDMGRAGVDLRGGMQPYIEEYADVTRLLRGGRPQTACLIMSMTDHGERTEDDRVESRRFTKKLVAAQREAARLSGCGFFDTYEATGGAGTAARWYRAGLLAPDLGHPTGAGHEVIAGLLFNALLHGYEAYRARMQGKPLPELAGGAFAKREPARTPARRR